MSESVSDTYDSAHDPYCPFGTYSEVSGEKYPNQCQCYLIQKVRWDYETPHGSTPWYKGRNEGREEMRIAVRKAVTAVPPIDQRVDANGLVSLVYDKGEILDAIDALRGSGNPHTPPSAEKGEQA